MGLMPETTSFQWIAARIPKIFRCAANKQLENDQFQLVLKFFAVRYSKKITILFPAQTVKVFSVWAHKSMKKDEFPLTSKRSFNVFAAWSANW
jgi:hypothetical protein